MSPPFVLLLVVVVLLLLLLCLARQIERLTSDALKSAAALNVDDAEKRLVALGQQLNQVKSELAAEQRAHQHSRDLLMTLQQRWQEKVDQLAHFEQQHAATEAQAT